MNIEKQKLFSDTAIKLTKLIDKKVKLEKEVEELEERYLLKRRNELDEIGIEIRNLVKPFIGEQFNLQNHFKVKLGEDYERISVDSKKLKTEFPEVYNQVLNKSITKGRLTITAPKV